MVGGEERRRQPPGDLWGRQAAGTGEQTSPPFCTFELEAGLRQAGFIWGGGDLLKKPQWSVMELECEG